MGRQTISPEDRLQFECLTFMQKHLFKEKHSRQDFNDRQARNKQTAVTMVKSSLNKCCKAPALALRGTQDVIVREVNKAIAEAYLLANLHVLRMCETEQAVPPLDQSFLYGCLSAVSPARHRKTAIKDCRFRDTVELCWSWRASCQGSSNFAKT